MATEEIGKYDLDDLVFEGRNKAYGAYFLRKIYNKHLATGMFFSLLIMLFISIIPFILVHMSAWMMGAPQYVEVNMDNALIELPLPPSVQIKLPGAEKPEPEKEEAMLKTVVPDFEKITDKPQTKDSTTSALGIVEKDGENNPGGPAGQEGVVIAEVYPSFPGGKERMDAFIRANVRYPFEEVERRRQGSVYVSFVVRENGILDDIKIASGVSELLDAEAIRVINMMPPWNPGFHKGKAVTVPVKVPIAFRLN